MGNITDTFNDVYRDYETAGVPASGGHEPVKSEIRTLGPLLEQTIALGLGNVDVTYATEAELAADLDHAADSLALVYADPTEENNDLWVKVGASGSGSWTNTGALRSNIETIIAPYVAQVVDLAARIGGPYDETATALDAYLAAITQELVLYNAKSHDYRISLVKTGTDAFIMDVWDEQIADRVGYFQILTPDYENLPERILLTPMSRLSSAYSGLEGWLKLNADEIIESASVLQFTDPTESRLNRRTVKTRFQYRDPHPADEMHEIIEVGAARDLTGLRDSLESLYDGGPLADQTNASQLPVCLRANPMHRIGLVFDAGTYEGFSEHIPDHVYLFARHRHQTIFEHSPGATTPIIEGQANTGGWGIVVRSTVAGEYGWHMDYAHLVLTPDLEGDINRRYWNIFRDFKFIVGSAGTQQVYGSGIATNAGARFVDCEFDCENGAYTGILAAANKASATTGNVGGGVFEFENCWDRSGRAVPAVGVQNKIATTYPSILRINDCRGLGFAAVAHAAGGNSTLGQWVLTGNNTITAGDITSDVVGETLGL